MKKQPPGVGKMPKADNTSGMNPTAPASGKAHKSSGGGERKGSYPNAPSDFPSLNGKLNKTRRQMVAGVGPVGSRPIGPPQYKLWRNHEG